MTIKIGILSTAHMHAYSYAAAINQLPNAELIGIADHNQNRAQTAATAHNTRYFATYEELVSADIDAVVIGSENVRHKELTLLAAQAGRHVLCEKPLATTLEDGLEMIATCHEAGVQLMTAFPCRFSPAILRLKSALDAGKIGDVIALRGTNRGRCPFDWFVDLPLSGGGAVIDHTVHVTDLMRWLLGQEVRSVYAEISNKMYGKAFDDTGMLTLEFESGVFATLDSSWSRPKSFPTWGDVTLSVIGEKGILSLDMFAQSLVHYSDKTGGASWHHWGDNIDLLMMQSFVDAVQAGVAVPITGEDGLRAALVALAAYQSTRAGHSVAPASLN
jgi:myo-inositol 2-dehydrogenase/D-chiro-inositol 1-dehydrogenase